MSKSVLGTDIGLPEVVTLVFALIALLLTLNHELWRDELQPWLIAKSSASLPELVRNMRYEPHVLAWPLGLFVLTRFSDQTFPIQILHLVLAVIAVYIFLRYSLLTKTQKILAAFGYFSIYEYCIVCRPYVIGALLVYCFCALFRASRNKNLVALSIILFLLCQTSAYGVLLAFGFGFMLLFEAVYDRGFRGFLGQRKLVLIISAIIIATGAMVAVFQVTPPPDGGFAPGWHLGFEPTRLARTAAVIWQAYAPVPEIKYEFWDTNIVSILALRCILSFLLLFFFVFLFIRKPVVLSLYGSGTVAVLIFTYVKYHGRIRHHGALFILLIACLWLANYYPARALRSGFADKLAGFCSKHAGKVVLFVLFAQLAGAIVAGTVDMIYPFSASKEVAEFIKDNNMDHMLIVGDRDFEAMAVSGHLGREIYYPRGNRMGTYIICDAKRRYTKPGEVFRTAKRLADERREDVLILLNYDAGQLPRSVTRIREFTRSVVTSEKFNLYLMGYGKEGH
jgi:hypothetical protein